MRQNSTNVFNEGLNYDLNPITTPNNVLTDCVNGTFITFNGDELALQNDAGNTKIAVPGTDPIEYVELSSGFYPLGIKEYGGVLYIVSAETPDFSSWVEWSDTIWPLDAVVYQTVLDEIIYYKSLILDNTNALDTDYWEMLGSKVDAINKLSNVEFGSYPSPEGASVREFSGKDREYNNTSIDLTTMYKKLLINDAIFKSSRYIIFDGDLSEDIDISRISGKTYNNGYIEDIKLFYKVKLFHRLNNGYLDLTTRINDKYTDYLKDRLLADGIYRWFTDDEFRFYAPSQYKGQLAISLEIEDLETFELYGFPGFSFNGTHYEFKLKIEGIGNGYITVPEARVEIWIDDVPYDFGGVYYEDITLTNNIGEFLLPNLLFDDYHDKEVRYRITPIIKVEGNKYAEDEYSDDYGDLPQEYIDKYVIEGSRLVDTLYDDVYFSKDDPDCYLTSKYKINEVITLTALDGTYLDLTLAPADPQIAHVFVRKDIYDAAADYDAENGVVTIATFEFALPEVINYRPINVVIIQEDIYEVVITMFKKQTIAEISQECIPQNTFVPTVIGLASRTTFYLMDDAGQTRYISFPEIVFPEQIYSGVNGEIRTIRYSVDYDKDNKQLLFGEANGWLSIIDLSIPNDPKIKRIRISTDNQDITCVKILETGTNSAGGDEGKEILMSTRNMKVFRQPFRTDYSQYIQGEGGQVTIDGGTGGEILDFAYDGRYLAIDSRYDIYHSLSLTGTLDRIKSFDNRGYKIGVGQQYFWWLGYLPKGNTEDLQLRYSPRSNYENWSLRGGFSGDMMCVDLEMLDEDNLLITDLRTNRGMRLVPGSSGDILNVTEQLLNDSSSYYNNFSEPVYTGGTKYDGSKYIYIGTKYSTGFYSTESKIMKYNLYKGVGEDLWSEIDAPTWFEKIFIY